MSTLWASMGVLLLVGCGGPAPESHDGGWRADGGSQATEGADVRVEEAWWTSSGELRLSTALENLGPRAIEGHATQFELEDPTGRRVRGRSSGRGDCAAGHRIAPGDTARCTLRFIGAFEPAHPPAWLHHPAGQTAIARCGPDAAFGLCELGEVCVDGACAAECSVTDQDGACVNEDQVCQAGVCVTPCSDSPESGCEEGVCVDGVCELACHGLALRDDGCWSCLWDVIDAGRCEVEDRCRDCADCVGGRVPGEAAATTCECLADPVCDGCGAEGRDYWSCVVDACPRCRE